MTRKPYPEDGPEFLEALKRRQAERRKAAETQHLVDMVFLERIDRERRAEEFRRAKARAKATLIRTQHISDDAAQKAMRKARSILGKFDWEK